MNRWQLKAKDERGKLKNTGVLEIRNAAENEVDLYMLGDIISDSWYKWTHEDTCPRDILEFFNQIENAETINVHINSGGGSVFGGIAIANLLRQHKARVVTHITALAASIAGYIAMCGDEIVVYEDSMFMIHKPSSSLWGGTADDFRKEADLLDKCQELILTGYMNKARDNISENQIKDMINAETWLTGSEMSTYFDVTMEKATKAVAWASSEFYEFYEKVPEKIAASENKTPPIKNTIEQEKNEILKDLWLYG